MRLSCRNLSKTYKSGTLALHNFTLNFEPGIYGFLGDNGAGKTTLMQILATVLSPDKGGEIFFNEEEIADNIAKYRGMLGFIPQECGYPEYIRVRKLLLLIAQFKKLDLEEANVQIDTLLDLMNLKEKANQYVGALSNGMKQRLSIIQGFLGNPKVVLLDEPTRGLDIHEQNKMYNFLLSQKDKIILLSSHITQDITSTCESVLVMDKGKLLYFGKIQDLIDLYADRIFQNKKGEIFLKVEDHLALSLNSDVKNGNAFVIDNSHSDWSLFPVTLKEAYLSKLIEYKR